MNKAELIDRLSAQLGSRRDATLAVESLVDVVIREVAAGGSVGITGFGTFERADRAPRTGRNPRTGESVPIPGTSTPRFRPGTYFKSVVTEPAQLPTDGLAGGRAPATTATRRTRATTRTATGSRTGTGAAKATSSKGTSGKTSQPDSKKGKAVAKEQTEKKDKAVAKEQTGKKGKSGKGAKEQTGKKGKSGKGAKKSKKQDGTKK